MLQRLTSQRRRVRIVKNPKTGLENIWVETEHLRSCYRLDADYSVDIQNAVNASYVTEGIDSLVVCDRVWQLSGDFQSHFAIHQWVAATEETASFFDLQGKQITEAEALSLAKKGSLVLVEVSTWMIIKIVAALIALIVTPIVWFSFASNFIQSMTPNPIPVAYAQDGTPCYVWSAYVTKEREIKGALGKVACPYCVQSFDSQEALDQHLADGCPYQQWGGPPGGYGPIFEPGLGDIGNIIIIIGIVATVIIVLPPIIGALTRPS